MKATEKYMLGLITEEEMVNELRGVAAKNILNVDFSTRVLRSAGIDYVKVGASVFVLDCGTNVSEFSKDSFWKFLGFGV